MMVAPCLQLLQSPTMTKLRASINTQGIFYASMPGAQPLSKHKRVYS